MRRRVENNGVTIQAIAGTHSVFLGFDLGSEVRAECLGFSIHREDHKENEQYWVSGFKTFRSVVPNPDPATFYSSRDHPFQTFYWGDYTAKPNHEYTYRVVPRFGKPKNLQDRSGIEATIDISTGDPDSAPHGIYFNRGVAASQAYANRFGLPPKKLPPEKQKEAFDWLSRGLKEALLAFIGQAKSSGYALRAAVYQFTHPDVLAAFREAHLKGADVKIVFHARTDDTEGPPNIAAVEQAQIKGLTIPRTKAPIAHNKFIVLCKKKSNGTLDPVAVWTGSTNLSEGGIFGHSNVGHAVRDPAVASKYLAYWAQVSENPDPDVLQAWVDAQSPFVEADVQSGPAVHVLFSPRTDLGPLNWYAGRFGSVALTGITAPFGLASEFEKAILPDATVLHHVMLNTKDNNQDAWATRPTILVAVGSLGGPDSLSRWAREHLSGLNKHAVYVHTKILMIDPLGLDPTVISGSANFSDPSTTDNDENMLVIRGDRDATDVYFTEYSRIFNHFYARYWAAQLRKKDGSNDVQSFLNETSSWQDPYFADGHIKHMQRVLYSSGVKGNT